MMQKYITIFLVFIALSTPVIGQFDTGTYYSGRDPASTQYATYRSFGISFEYPASWQTFESSPVNPSEGNVMVQSGLLADPMDFLSNPTLMGEGSLQMLIFTVSWSKALGNRGLDSAMNSAILQRRQKYREMNVLDQPSIMVDGNRALVKKIDGSITDGYSTASSYEFVTVFISSKTNRSIEISCRKTFRDFQDSDIEYLRHMLSTWTETPITYNLGMPLAPTENARTAA